MNKCLDCKEEIDKRAKRCPKCAGKIHSQKMKGIPKKDGCSLKIYRCIKCNKIIGWQSFVYGTKKCKSCSHIKNNKTFNNSCLDCGKHISFASKRCNRCATLFKIKKGIIKIKVGKEHWHYKDGMGYSPYSFDFFKIREKILKRDKYKCQIPNCKSKSRIEVHHVDHDKNNNNENNLITLCHKCNMKEERIH